MVRFGREGVKVAAGWRGEVNVPGLTQVRPDLLVQVSGGALGAGTHCIEFEPTAVRPERVAEKLGPYRRRAAAHADRYPGAGTGRAGDRSGYGVEHGRGSDGAALPVEAGGRNRPVPTWVRTGTLVRASASTVQHPEFPGSSGLQRVPGAGT